MNCDKLSRILLRTAVAIFLIAAAIRICTYSCHRNQSDISIEHKADNKQEQLSLNSNNKQEQ